MKDTSRGGPRVTRSRDALTTAAGAALLLAATQAQGQIAALKAAGGFKDVKPIEGVSRFVDGLQGNLSWLFITALILVVLTVGFLFMSGHSRAHEYALRVVVGAAIVASAGGIVA